MNNCTPGAVTPAVDNPCAFLPQLRAAYYQLAAGQALAQVRNGEQWTTYQRPDMDRLERDIRRLEIECGSNRGRAVLVGPRFANRSLFRRNSY